MSKMSELDTAITELRKCGETLIDIAGTLRGLFSDEADETAKAAQPEVHVLRNSVGVQSKFPLR